MFNKALFYFQVQIANVNSMKNDVDELNQSTKHRKKKKKKTTTNWIIDC